MLNYNNLKIQYNKFKASNNRELISMNELESLYRASNGKSNSDG